MSITVNWDNELRTIVRYELEGNWTWDELGVALEQANDMMSTVSHTVDVIVDMAHGAWLPRGNLLMRGKKIMVMMPPDNMGLTVVVGGTAFVEAIASALSRVYTRLNEKIVFASSVEDAHRLIASKPAASVDADPA